MSASCGGGEAARVDVRLGRDWARENDDDLRDVVGDGGSGDLSLRKMERNGIWAMAAAKSSLDSPSRMIYSSVRGRDVTRNNSKFHSLPNHSAQGRFSPICQGYIPHLSLYPHHTCQINLITPVTPHYPRLHPPGNKYLNRFPCSSTYRGNPTADFVLSRHVSQL